MAGTLDTTFGTNGYTLSDFGGNISSEANAQVIDSNNCTIVTGYTNATDGSYNNKLYLAKYTSTGLLDTTFGAGKGYIIGDYYTGKASSGNSLVLDSTGNILVTGYARDNNGVKKLLLAKYKSNGELDTSFGGKGWLTSDFGYTSSYYTEGSSLALDSSGRIVVTGNVHSFNGDSSEPVLFLLTRYTSSGDLDKTFGGNGTGWSNITDSTINLYGGKSIIIDKTTGSIIVLGNVFAGPGGQEIFYKSIIAKFTNTGILDTAFGAGKGYVSTIKDTDYIFDGNLIKLDTSNRILFVGCYYKFELDPDNDKYDILLAGYNSTDGTLDTTFGEKSGYIITTIPNYNSYGNSLVIDSNDRIIVTGYLDTAGTLLLRYTSSGKLDKTFGGSGLGYSISSFGTRGNAVSLDNNGLIIVSGYAGTESLIARFYNGSIITTTSTTTTTTTTIPYSTTTSTTSTTTIPYSTTTSTTTHYQPICLVAGTPILTDQGIVAIEKIDPKKHSINHKRIVAITKAITPEKHLVVIEANSFGPNIPNRRTIMTPSHCVMVKGALVPAQNLLGRVRGVHSIPYNGRDVLYNVLMEKYDVMITNNMVIETLHPRNTVARKIMNELHYS